MGEVERSEAVERLERFEPNSPKAYSSIYTGARSGT